jgi:hypothetical protein
MVVGITVFIKSFLDIRQYSCFLETFKSLLLYKLPPRSCDNQLLDKEEGFPLMENLPRSSGPYSSLHKSLTPKKPRANITENKLGFYGQLLRVASVSNDGLTGFDSGVEAWAFVSSLPTLPLLIVSIPCLDLLLKSSASPLCAAHVHPI